MGSSVGKGAVETTPPVESREESIPVSASESTCTARSLGTLHETVSIVMDVVFGSSIPAGLRMEWRWIVSWILGHE